MLTVHMVNKGMKEVFAGRVILVIENLSLEPHGPTSFTVYLVTTSYMALKATIESLVVTMMTEFSVEEATT